MRYNLCPTIDCNYINGIMFSHTNAKGMNRRGYLLVILAKYFFFALGVGNSISISTQFILNSFRFNLLATNEMYSKSRSVIVFCSNDKNKMLVLSGMCMH